jgi:hypothetical protein
MNSNTWKWEEIDGRVEPDARLCLTGPLGGRNINPFLSGGIAHHIIRCVAALAEEEAIAVV